MCRPWHQFFLVHLNSVCLNIPVDKVPLIWSYITLYILGYQLSFLLTFSLNIYACNRYMVGQKVCKLLQKHKQTFWTTQYLVYTNLYNKTEEKMATHSCILAWEIPWTEEPSRLQFTGSHMTKSEWFLTFLKYCLQWWLKQLTATYPRLKFSSLYLYS